jgi:hypothetical protein
MRICLTTDRRIPFQSNHRVMENATFDFLIAAL